MILVQLYLDRVNIIYISRTYKPTLQVNIRLSSLLEFNGKGIIPYSRRKGYLNLYNGEGAWPSG